MNEAFIKKMIKYKLKVAGTIIECLPLKMADEMKSLGRVILESTNESLQEMEGQCTKKAKPMDKLDNVPIE